MLLMRVGIQVVANISYGPPLRKLAKCPQLNLCFLITICPEINILTGLPPSPQLVHKQMGDIPEDIVDGDIERFIQHLLQEYMKLKSFWLNQEWCQLLVHYLQKLFQWAFTACNFIQGDDAVGLDLCEWFEIVIQVDNDEGVCLLDKFYRTILEQHFTLEGAQRCFQEVMAVMLALNEPLSTTSLSTLFTGCLNVQDIIKPMGSLLDGALDKENQSIHFILHSATFYLMKPAVPISMLIFNPNILSILDEYCLHACKICLGSISVTSRAHGSLIMPSLIYQVG